jgi:carboxyl-terminal processing protease
VQTLLPLDNGDSVKLTTARYYTPSGKSIQARGISRTSCCIPPRTPSMAARPITAKRCCPATCVATKKAMAGSNAGEVLDGDAPITAALAELKKPVPAQPAPAERRRRRSSVATPVSAGAGGQRHGRRHHAFPVAASRIAD